jgi:hypothetical protein
VLVTPRLLHGRTGYWVVTPLVVKDTGARLAVVRGFVADAAQATPPAATGPVTVNGTLAPGESPSTGAALPAGQLGSVDLSLLVNRPHGGLGHRAGPAAAAAVQRAQLAQRGVRAAVVGLRALRRVHVVEDGPRRPRGPLRHGRPSPN